MPVERSNRGSGDARLAARRGPAIGGRLFSHLSGSVQGSGPVAGKPRPIVRLRACGERRRADTAPALLSLGSGSVLNRAAIDLRWPGSRGRRIMVG